MPVCFLLSLSSLLPPFIPSSIHHTHFLSSLSSPLPPVLRWTPTHELLTSDRQSLACMCAWLFWPWSWDLCSKEPDGPHRSLLTISLTLFTSTLVNVANFALDFLLFLFIENGNEYIGFCCKEGMSMTIITKNF